MKNTCKYQFVVFYLILFSVNSAISFAASGDTLWAPSLHPYGRYAKTANGDLELISSAVHFGFRFTGTNCKVFAYISDLNSSQLSAIHTGWCLSKKNKDRREQQEAIHDQRTGQAGIIRFGFIRPPKQRPGRFSLKKLLPLTVLH